MLATPLFLLASASPYTMPAIVDDAANVASPAAAPVEALSAPEAATELLPAFASDSQTPTVVVVQPPKPQTVVVMAPPPPPRPRMRFTVKGGSWDSNDDGFDDGTPIIVSWIRPMSPTLSSEVELGYLDADGTNNGVDRDVWSISMMANARFTIPVGKSLELYGGLGLGTFYYDAEASIGGVHASTDGFLFAGDGYFGGSIHVGEKLSIGLEGKYYVTDETSELDGGLEGFAALLTVGFDM